MAKKRYTQDDFKQLSWEEYQIAVDTVFSGISKYLRKNDIKVDFVVPILRGGAPLGISLAHLLSVVRFYPCQYKYYYDKEQGCYVAYELLSTVEMLADKNKEYVILVTEGNHARGGTAQKCINKIKMVLPNSIVLYVSVGRDYAHMTPLKSTNFETWGFLTNETESLTIKECMEKGIKQKFVVYPWESMEEEIYEVNSSLDCE